MSTKPVALQPRRPSRLQITTHVQARIEGGDHLHTLDTYAVALHPPTEVEPWCYTRTYFTEVRVMGRTFSVRGHVHYAEENGAYVPGPGYYWISDVEGWSRPTPNAIVQLFAVLTDEERANGTAVFNINNKTNHDVL